MFQPRFHVAALLKTRCATAQLRRFEIWKKRLDFCLHNNPARTLN